MANSEDKKKKTPFFKGVKSEFKKITWPKREVLLKQSIVVVVISAVMGAVIALLDYVIQYGVDFLTSL